MGICPSNTMVQGNSFPNYAGRNDVDDLLRQELEQAGIKALSFETLKTLKTKNREVKTSIIGELEGWKFEREWYYWVVTGECYGYRSLMIPHSYALELYRKHREDVRIDGLCEPVEPCGSVSSYHVDTFDGLKALADTIKQVTNQETQVVDKVLKAADEIAKVFGETTEWLDPKRAAVIKILKELVEEQ